MPAPGNFDLGLGFAEANAFTAPQTTQAGTVFNFGGVAGGAESWSDQSGATAGATASASGGSGIPNGNPNARINPAGITAANTGLWIAGGILLAAAVAGLVYYYNQS